MKRKTYELDRVGTFEDDDAMMAMLHDPPKDPNKMKVGESMESYIVINRKLHFCEVKRTK